MNNSSNYTHQFPKPPVTRKSAIDTNCVTRYDFKYIHCPRLMSNPGLPGSGPDCQSGYWSGDL